MGDTDRWKSRLPWVAFAAGTVLCIFSSGRWNIPITAWIWPFLLLYFEKSQTWKKGLGLTLLALTLAHIIKWIGVFAAGFPIDEIAGAILGFTLIIPFAVDRIVAYRFKGVLATLVFPLAWVAYDYLRSFMVFGPGGSIAYTQYGNLPLSQLVSVTGLFGLTFLIAWFASALEYAVTHPDDLRQSARPAAYCMLAIVLVSFCGGAKMIVKTPQSETVRIASANGNSEDFVMPADGKLHMASLDEDVSLIREKAITAHAIGASILCFSEEAFTVDAPDRQPLIEQAAAIAKDQNLYILLAVDCSGETETSLRHNFDVFLNPEGEVEWTYTKTHLVPFIEDTVYEPGDGHIFVSSTPYGNISSTICYDSDYPSFTRSVGATDADILIIASWDWEAILGYHSQSGSFRAIENGVSMVKTTNCGSTIAVDYNGKTLSMSDTFTTDSGKVLIADVPTEGIITVYSIIGDVFDWVCIAALVAMIIAAARMRTKANG